MLHLVFMLLRCRNLCFFRKFIHLFSVGLLGFVGFVVNLLNRPTDGATVRVLKSACEKVRPKKSYFLSEWEYVKLPFSLRVPKNLIIGGPNTGSVRGVSSDSGRSLAGQ
jgi:hypothetical protein